MDDHNRYKRRIADFAYSPFAGEDQQSLKQQQPSKSAMEEYDSYPMTSINQVFIPWFSLFIQYLMTMGRLFVLCILLKIALQVKH